MSHWLKSKKQMLKRRRQKAEESRIFDVLFELLIWFLELIISPIRLVVWFMKGIGRFIGLIFDIH
ncbi:hypothetical protein [Halobacillus sp. Nhm2S1]|uniref:hypothetical protein n=1 Tax=Halobacillus sp. Nhm2S1 TaxID=2866716 RepID=UPI001C73DF1E|nr:hypothetical protein [Halobacillus sp. Nhm2S1]MBX0358598.1 hypothetical protein [Halobacillus sp. Nhm2S1]